MLGLHRNRAFEGLDYILMPFGTLVRILTFSYLTFRPVWPTCRWRFRRCTLVASWRHEMIGNFIDLATELILILTLGYVSTDWHNRYWGV